MIYRNYLHHPHLHFLYRFFIYLPFIFPIFFLHIFRSPYNQQYIYYCMSKPVLLLSIVFLIFVAKSAYEPQLMMTATSDIINKQIAIKYGKTISDKINEYKVADIHAEQKASGVNVKFNLTQIKQKIAINWKANILQVKNTHTFTINSKNINLTLDGQLQVKIGPTRKQKGPLKVSVEGLQVDITLHFASSKCQKGIGFDLQIDDVYVNAKSLSIKIEGKGFDNYIIAELEKILTPRVPGLVKNAITEKVNPLISEYTCMRIQQNVPVGSQNYILVLNTTEVPQFDEGLKYLRIPIDITFQNLRTNQTNDQLQRDDLPLNQLFQNSSDISLALSSNFLNTVIWLVDDSELLYGVVTGDMLGPNPPIALNTTNLSILMPKLKEKWPNKEVFLVISPSTKYEHLLIRSGRIVTVLSLSVKFAVNVTGKPLPMDQCLASGDCVIACDLNMTLPVSVAVKLGSKLAFGLLHNAGFYDIQIIDSKIDINVLTLKSIINEIIGSMLPDLNEQLSTGMQLPEKIWQLLAKNDISDIMSKIFLDYMAVGLKIDL